MKIWTFKSIHEDKPSTLIVRYGTDRKVVFMWDNVEIQGTLEYRSIDLWSLHIRGSQVPVFVAPTNLEWIP